MIEHVLEAIIRLTHRAIVLNFGSKLVEGTAREVLSQSSDGSIFVLFRQEDKDFHQVKSWPPTQQLFIKSIIPNFGL